MLVATLILATVLGFSPAAPHLMASDMMDSHAQAMAMDSGNTTDQHAGASACLEHCLQVAAQTDENNFILAVALLAAFFAVITAITFLKKETFFVRRREWFRPLYLFDTVRLLE